LPYPENSPDPEGEFPLDTPQYLFYLIFQIDHHRNAAFAPVLEPFGLTLATWRTLSIVRRLEGCTMRSLAAYSTIDRTTLTRAVDQLVARGLVDRVTPPNDRRKVSLSLTAAGEAVHAQVIPALVAFNLGNLKALSPTRQREVTRALQTILKAVIGDPEAAEDILTFGRAGTAG
jgi:DNA-binding MarR family transcriptional regulator